MNEQTSQGPPAWYHFHPHPMSAFSQTGTLTPGVGIASVHTIPIASNKHCGALPARHCARLWDDKKEYDMVLLERAGTQREAQ